MTALLRLITWLVVLAIPLFGVWLSSSLAAFHNGPRWATILAGGLLFPGLPLLWELLAWRRRAKRAARRKDTSFLDDMRRRRAGPGLNVFDRLVLRTLAINLLFLGGVVWRFPETAVTALNARGDWMLEDQQAAWADIARQGLYATATGLTWAHEALNPNEYEDMLEGDGPAPSPDDPKPARDDEPDTPEPDTPEPSTDEAPEVPDPPDDPQEPSLEPPGRPQWPLARTLHPLVVDMPAEAEQSVASVAHYIRDSEPDPWMRVKALHDYVADRVAYDYAALAAGVYPPQDSDTVFRTNTAVCAGYSNLLTALGEAAGEEIVYVVGVSRDFGGRVGGQGHAWNAARIEGEWVLIDATWNAGHKKNGRFHKEYSTDYLFTPPELFGMNHLPDDPDWQLRDQPITMGEFVRQPMMRPSFYANGLSLLSPRRSQVDVDDTLQVRIDNPKGRFIVASYVAQGTPLSTNGDKCQVSTGDPIEVRCDFPARGSYEVRLFASEQQYGSYPYVGQLQANNAGSGLARAR